VIIDGEPGPEYARVSDLQFSPDSTRFACVACVGHGAEARYVPVIDGIVGPPSEKAFPVVFSPDGRRVAYCSQEFLPRTLFPDLERKVDEANGRLPRVGAPDCEDATHLGHDATRTWCSECSHAGSVSSSA